MDETLRRLQLTQLEILKVVDRFCRENDIKYTLCGGTLLGAVRHKGFIPWDDDLDIGMTRDNYDRFICLWEKNPPKGYLLQNKDNTPSFTQFFTKIRKEHTTFLQEVDNPYNYPTGIFIDVFPYDRIPNSKYKRALFTADTLMYLLYTKEYVPTNGNVLVRVMSNFALRVVPDAKHRLVRRFFYKKVTAHNNDPKNAIVAIESISSNHRPNPINISNEYIELPFEDGRFMCFKDYDLWLRRAYGDYMQLPPLSERKGIHNPTIIDFKCDYWEHMEKQKDLR